MPEATGSHRSALLLLAAALLVGQATGLHHAHASGADCPPGTCFHHAAASDSGARWVDSDDCPLCDLLHQGRTVTPAAALAPEGAPAADARSQPTSGLAPTSCHALDGGGPRAPPRSA